MRFHTVLELRLNIRCKIQAKVKSKLGDTLLGLFAVDTGDFSNLTGVYRCTEFAHGL